MKKTKFFMELSLEVLEEKVNSFIQNKEVFNISYSAIVLNGRTGHGCCILYENKK